MKPVIFFFTGLGVVLCGFFDFMQLAWGEAKGVWHELEFYIFFGSILFIVFFVTIFFIRKVSIVEKLFKFYLVTYALGVGGLFAWVMIDAFLTNGHSDIGAYFSDGLPILFSIVPFIFVVLTVIGIKEKA